MRHLRWLSAAIVLLIASRSAPAQQAAKPAQSAPPGYAGSASCIDCHKKDVGDFMGTPMGKVLLQHPRDSKEQLGCESCHGPGKQHAESGGEERGALVYFSKKTKTPVAERNAVCLQCHEKTARMLWKGSMHESRDVACTDCHNVMHPGSETGALAKPSVMQTCQRCHATQVAKVTHYSHMPIAQGKMECTSCHNPHGSANEKLLVASSVNETCFACHTEKRGPYLWEHAPVTENCANCHDVHGTPHEKMLKVTRPRLCQQCHASSGHPITPRGLSLPADVQFVFNRQCSTCHVQIHGSNHPSGRYLNR
jgi:DmsE family decaheme c-type cytochrome